MPIKGLSDRSHRPPRLGKIHLGIKVQDGDRSYPRKTDYFVCTPPVQEVFGKEPKELRILFPTDDQEQWASVFFRAYSSYRGLVCKGDGEIADRLVDMDKVVDKTTGALPDDKSPGHWPIAHREASNTRRQDIECHGTACPQYRSKACKQVMNLQFILPEVTGLGVWQIDTSSWNSIKNVLAVISLLQGLVGRFSGIPLTLSLAPQEVTPEGQGKKTIHVLHLTAPYRLNQLREYAALPPGQALALPPADLDPPEDLGDEEEAAVVPPVTIDSFFVPDGATRQNAWDGIRAILVATDATPLHVVGWLKKEAGIEIVPASLGQPKPPDTIPDSTLVRLHGVMSQYQLKLGSP